jgi:hypothetical protein
VIVESAKKNGPAWTLIRYLVSTLMRIALLASAGPGPVLSGREPRTPRTARRFGP